LRGKPPKVIFILIMRSVLVGLAYYMVRELPGLTSSFVALFVGMLAFDLIVSLPKFSLRFKHLKKLFLLVLPRISGTALSLGTGLFLGLIFGGLIKIGLPVLIGAVFTLGLSYSFSAEFKGNISNYVGMIAGIELFDQIRRLEYWGEEWMQELAGPAGRMIYSTFLALLIGWFIGIIIGSITRLFLSRGYRSIKSNAYDQPLWMRSFKDVTKLDGNKVLLQIELSAESPLANHSLAESRLGSELGIQVLSIIRPPHDVLSPRGSDVLLPLDQLVVVLPSEQVKTLISLMKGRVLSE